MKNMKVFESVIVLDRDGVINVDCPEKYCASWDKWQWTPKAREALRYLKQMGYRTAIATNQSGVARGWYTKQQYYQLMDKARQDLAQFHGSDDYWPDVVAECFHDIIDNCGCRKPRTGMWTGIIAPAIGDVSVSTSWMVGDRDSDVEFGKAIGMQAVKLGIAIPTLYDFAEKLKEDWFGASCPWRDAVAERSNDETKFVPSPPPRRG